MKRAVIEDESADCYLDNFCTQAPHNNHYLDCVSTDTENSDSNGHNHSPNQTCDKNNFPMSIHCSTVKL